MKLENMKIWSALVEEEKRSRKRGRLLIWRDVNAGVFVLVILTWDGTDRGRGLWYDVDCNL